MASHERRRVKDLDTLKALAHPLRMKLYRALQVADTATASQLADQVDEAVSLVSYHLRKLAANGLIEEAAAGRGDGRERWWQASSDGVSTRDEDFRGTPEGVVVHNALMRTHAGQLTEMYDTFLDTQAAWSQQWRDAAFCAEYLMPLTAEEVRAFGEEIRDLAAKWRAHGKAAIEAGDTEGRENVAVHAYGFPFTT
ncbi:MAG: helix-turn-helix transcriptional regulator [Nonomuraea sp.]|nr:helix-turn-helix transcriptional regulator [Nonomuraea sp.]NUP66215.1 helix-turn-helix transcriptional regulator [Nonomuraea sp.]NUS01002.1 helix-turn-helix transcriptional regulator [Nonomuraea sp.]NUT10510.1 helix-turn-helix transcriptional regulator [Nonomuraea sp.]